MTSSASKMSESKLKLKDAEGNPLKQLELLESSTCYQAIGVFSLYNELETGGELRMQHVQHWYAWAHQGFHHLGAALYFSRFSSGSPSVQAVFGLYGTTSPAVFEADHPCYLVR